MSAWALVPAAGKGWRMGGATPKQFLTVAGRPILLWALQAIASWPRLRGIVVVAASEELARVRRLVGEAGVPQMLRVVAGGAERQDSVRLGLQALVEAGADDLVLVHDGARPFPPVDRFDELCDAARPFGALLAVPCRDTLKRGDRGASSCTVDRTELWQAQTPQAFPVRLLQEALQAAEMRGDRLTDDAALVEALGLRPNLVLGDARNIKVTTPEDLVLAEALAAWPKSGLAASPSRPDPTSRPSSLHIGHGYDAHRLVQGRPLVLGGVVVPHEKGLLGHSDADVLAHAVADACLGAAGLGDIGRHFPDTDPEWKDASSLSLLERVARMLRDDGYRLLRVDATLVAQRPKVAALVPQMEANLSRSLSWAGAPAALGFRLATVKATTTEGMGFEGREEGVSAHAVVLLAREACRDALT